MGRRGWSIPLSPIPAAKHATMKRVRSSLIDVLADLWYHVLPSPWGRFAGDWITMGEDSLLRFGDEESDGEIPTELTFWFYEGAQWPQALADHWLRLML